MVPRDIEFRMMKTLSECLGRGKVSLGDNSRIKSRTVVTLC
jgi:hypothetical protein